MEILCHRERANSVMLIGEPGVGKTAIAEGLARRIEFEPETLPVRLRIFTRDTLPSGTTAVPDEDEDDGPVATPVEGVSSSTEEQRDEGEGNTARDAAQSDVGGAAGAMRPGWAKPRPRSAARRGKATV